MIHLEMGQDAAVGEKKQNSRRAHLFDPNANIDIDIDNDNSKKTSRHQDGLLRRENQRQATYPGVLRIRAATMAGMLCEVEEEGRGGESGDDVEEKKRGKREEKSDECTQIKGNLETNKNSFTIQFNRKARSNHISRGGGVVRSVVVSFFVVVLDEHSPALSSTLFGYSPSVLPWGRLPCHASPCLSHPPHPSSPRSAHPPPWLLQDPSGADGVELSFSRLLMPPLAPTAVHSPAYPQRQYCHCRFFVTHGKQ